MNPIAQKIKESRLKANMSEKDLAKKCGVAPSYIIQIESGKKIVNEKTAENILAVFGEKVGFDFQDQISDEREPVQTVEKKKEVAKPSFYEVEPNDQWAGALANLIKKFSITEVTSKKVVGYKELPILGKKVEGIAWERVLFVKAIDDELESVRIRKGDVLMIHEMKEVQGKGIYLIEMNQKRMLRVVYKESGNKLIIGMGKKDNSEQSSEASQVKIIGKCVRVEFELA